MIGKAHVYMRRHINTDEIIPARYLTTDKEDELAKHAMEDLDIEFVNRVKKGDFIIAGEDFGCGSSREQAATCLKYAGISAVIAKSFSRIFFRNGINQGLPTVVCIEAMDSVTDGDVIEVDFSDGVINLASGETIKFKEFPDFIFSILDAGGLIPYVRSKINA